MSAPAAAQPSIAELRDRAFAVREHVLGMGASPEGAHVGGGLSAADIMVALFFGVLRLRPEEPRWEGRDHFILSKGHASAVLYACLAERGFIGRDELATYSRAGSRLAGHPLRKVPGVEFPTGSLGHGLSLGIGLALAAKRDGRGNRVFVLMGDGELQEGSVWEAVMAASHHRLDNLVAVVDRNRLQISGGTEERMGLEPLEDRWRSFGWEARTLDGHDLGALLEAFGGAPFRPGAPSVVIARTLKGKGVRFLEGRKKSHYVNFTPELLSRAVRELRAGRGGAS
jgi:transketolase